MSKRTLKLGFKKLPHAQKMAAKAKHREQLAALPYRNPDQDRRIKFGVAVLKAMNAHNGVGRPPRREA